MALDADHLQPLPLAGGHQIGLAQVQHRRRQAQGAHQGYGQAGNERVHLPQAGGLGDEPSARLEHAGAARRRSVQVVQQVQHVEGQHRIERPVQVTGRGVGIVHLKPQRGPGAQRQPLVGQGNHLRGDVGGQVGAGEQRQRERRGAGAAADLKHRRAGAEQLPRAHQAALVTRPVADGAARVAAGKAVPETGFEGCGRLGGC